MAIGTLAAIGLGLAGAGSIISSGAQSRAANNASNISAQTARENNALAQYIYGQNQQALSPFMQRGNVAGNYFNAMLGIGSGQPQTVPQLGPGPLGGQGNPEPNGFLGGYGPQGGGYSGGYGGGTWTPTATTPGVTTQDAQNAFRQYIENSDYGFQFGEGSNRVNSGYAGAGTLKSGAAMQALERMRQNLQSGYRGEYMNALANQQGTGLSGAGALAGVSTNYSNSVAANNNSAGTAAANAALVRGNNSFGNTLSMLGGGLFGYRG